MNYEKIVITGGCGFLGQFVVRQLLETGNCPLLKIIDLKANGAALFDFAGDKNVEIVMGADVCDYDSIVGEFTGAYCVIHLAGVVSFSLKDELLLRSVNVDGTRNVLRAAHDNDVKCVIHVSSVAALGYNDDKDNPVNEEFGFDWSIAEKRKKFYMLTKHQADLEVAEFRRQGLNTVVVYPGLMFGPGDAANSARLIKAINSRKI
ncbi:MAG: NAD-dependent epimerase/dehydratase family protein, partial [Planctomycetes bacterium]|nr:NAD-dependent epimerase/dehydratase family protein [Planctomycetota bacterium]